MARESKHEDPLMNMPVDKLRALARVIHLQEAQRIKSVRFHSEYHRAQYLRESQEAYQLATRLLDVGQEAARKHKDDEVTASASHELFQYTNYAMSSACRAVWNLSLRKSYLEKLRAYAEEKAAELDKFKSTGGRTTVEIEEKARQLVEELAENKQRCLDFMESRKTWVARATGRGFRAFERRKTPGISMFDHMVTKYQTKLNERSKGVSKETIEKEVEKRPDGEPDTDGALEPPLPDDGGPDKLTSESPEPPQGAPEPPQGDPDQPTGGSQESPQGDPEPPQRDPDQPPAEASEPPAKGGAEGEYGGEFEELPIEKKTEVFTEILNSSGKGGRITNKVCKGLKGAGEAVIIFQLGIMVHDVCTSDHKWETFVKDSSELAAELGGGLLGEMIATTLAAELLAAFGVTVASGGLLGPLAFGVVALTGFVASWYMASVVGDAVADWVDKFFKSGGGGSVGKRAANSKVKKHVAVRHPSTEKLIYHVVPMPNGERLALQLTAACP